MMLCTSYVSYSLNFSSLPPSPLSNFPRYDRRDRPPRRGGFGSGGRDYYDGDRGYGGPRRRSPTDYDRRREDGPVERPKLHLQPRSKPREEQPSSTGPDGMTK